MVPTNCCLQTVNQLLHYCYLIAHLSLGCHNTTISQPTVHYCYLIAHLSLGCHNTMISQPTVHYCYLIAHLSLGCHNTTISQPTGSLLSPDSSPQPGFSQQPENQLVHCCHLIAHLSLDCHISTSIKMLLCTALFCGDYFQPHAPSISAAILHKQR